MLILVSVKSILLSLFIIHKTNSFSSVRELKEYRSHQIMRKTQSHILIIDDDPDILFAARVFLKRYFTQVTVLSKAKEVLQVLHENEIDVILMDMNYRKGIQDGKEGMYWFEMIKEYAPATVVILMTAYSDVSIAVESIKKGAFDFVPKPWDNDQLLERIQAAVKRSRKLRKSPKTGDLATENNTTNKYFMGNSPAFQRVEKVVHKVANTDANVLLLGENGTGKFVIAKLLHELSERKEEAFIHVDLGALSENLFESELFGYAQGAFTDAKESRLGRFELADKGTIFLDEIGNLPVHLQSKLLSVIQTKKVVRLGEATDRPIDVRIICATNADIPELIENQQFRQDLFYRINTVEITLPPLREREEDIASFANYFLEKNKIKYKKGKLQLSKAALIALEKHNWPGNIRELEHVLERAVILCDTQEILVDDLQFSRQKVSETAPESLNLEEMERHYVEQALRKHQGHITKAAKELGLTRAALYRRMEKFGL